MGYPAKEDCYIERDERRVRLLDEEGDEVFYGPPSWTDDQLWTMLAIAQRAYAKGAEDGQAAKARELRGVLGLAPLEAQVAALATEVAGLDMVVSDMARDRI